MDATNSPPESASRLCYVTGDSDTPGRRSLEKSRNCRIDNGASFLLCSSSGIGRAHAPTRSCRWWIKFLGGRGLRLRALAEHELTGAAVLVLI
jgi:hypothetical protein